MHKRIYERQFEVGGEPCEHLLVIDNAPSCLLFKQYLLDIVPLSELKRIKKEKICQSCVWYEKARNTSN
jgi:hypothetical protein